MAGSVHTACDLPQLRIGSVPKDWFLNTVNIFIQIICESLYSRIEVHHLVHVCSVEGRAVIELS